MAEPDDPAPPAPAASPAADDPAPDDPATAAASAAPADELRPQTSGSIEIPVDDGPSGATASGRRRRAPTASAIAEQVVQVAGQAADRVAAVADAVGGKIGEVVGESLTHLPGVPRTRRAAVLARSVVVGFCLVFAWIAVIVGLQLRGRHPPDFRPNAEAILVQLRDGDFEDLYKHSSERFQEVVREETFVAQMTDLNTSLGRFREITSVIHTEVNRGPGGRTGRVDLRLAYARTATRGSVSFRWEDGTWKLLGLSVEVPEKLLAVVGTEEARRERVAGNRAELRRLVETVLTTAFSGDVAGVWADAAEGFRQSTTFEAFQRTVEDHHRALGRFHRVLNITWAKLAPSRQSTSVDCLLEFDNGTVNSSFKFVKIDGVWRLGSYKIVLPLPRVPS